MQCTNCRADPGPASKVTTAIRYHTFRATGITIYLQNSGVPEKAQQMAAHESPRTTKLYDLAENLALDDQ